MIRGHLRGLAVGVFAALVPGCLKDPSSGRQDLPAPSGLRATALTDGGGIRLDWEDNSTSEASFRVDVSPMPILEDADVAEWASVPADMTTYVYAAPPNSTRYFRVLAVTVVHQSAPSNVVQAKSPDVPVVPGRFDAMLGPGDTDRELTAVWEDVANETGYFIQRSEDGVEWGRLGEVGADVTSYVDRTTQYGKSYAYRARAFNTSGSGAWTPVAWAETRSRSWHALKANTAGNTSWNVSLGLRAETAIIAAYDSTYGDLVCGAASPGSPGISAVTVDPGFRESLGFGSTSVAIGESGTIHVVAADAYGDALYHVTNDTGAWHGEVIDAAQDADRALIRKASDGALHVVYQHTEGAVRGLRHASRIGGSWVLDWAAVEPSVDYFDFAMDDAGFLRLVYRRSTASGHDLTLAVRSPGGAWTFERIPTSADPEMCSIAADASGRLFVAYNSIASGALHLVGKKGGPWIEEVVHRTPRGSWGRYNSISIRDSGEIHLAYLDNLHQDLRFASRSTGGTWKRELVDALGEVGPFASIGCDAAGGLFIGYADRTNGAFKIAMTHLQAPRELIAAPLSTSQVQLTWIDVPNETGYRLERRSSGDSQWSLLANLPADVGSFVDTGLASNQTYSYRLRAVNTFGNGIPATTPAILPAYVATVSVAGSSDYGSFNDLAARDGVLHIAHGDQTNTNVLYTTGPPQGPFATVVADAGVSTSSQGGYGSNSIALDGSGVLITSWLYEPGGVVPTGLRLTELLAEAKTTITLESGVNYGQYAKVRVAADGTTHVVYQESASGGIHWRHAVKTMGGWSLGGRITPQEVVSIQSNNSLAIGRDGTPHLAYHRKSSAGPSTELVYGSKTGPGWAFAPVPGTDDSLFVSLALGPENEAHVAYIAGLSLVYGTNAGGTWLLRVLHTPDSPISGVNPAATVRLLTRDVYVLYGDEGLWLARKKWGYDWEHIPLDLSSVSIRNLSIALGPDSWVYATYYDVLSKKLKVVAAQP